MADSDFDAITNNGKICDAEGNVGVEEFVHIMQNQIRFYTQNRLADDAFSPYQFDSDRELTQLGAIKMILMQQFLLEKKLQQVFTNLDMKDVPLVNTKEQSEYEESLKDQIETEPNSNTTTAVDGVPQVTIPDQNGIKEKALTKGLKPRDRSATRCKELNPTEVQPADHKKQKQSEHMAGGTEKGTIAEIKKLRAEITKRTEEQSKHEEDTHRYFENLKRSIETLTEAVVSLLPAQVLAHPKGQDSPVETQTISEISPCHPDYPVSQIGLRLQSQPTTLCSTAFSNSQLNRQQRLEQRADYYDCYGTARRDLLACNQPILHAGDAPSQPEIREANQEYLTRAALNRGSPQMVDGQLMPENFVQNRVPSSNDQSCISESDKTAQVRRKEWASNLLRKLAKIPATATITQQSRPHAVSAVQNFDSSRSLTGTPGSRRALSSRANLSKPEAVHVHGRLEFISDLLQSTRRSNVVAGSGGEDYLGMRVSEDHGDSTGTELNSPPQALLEASQRHRRYDSKDVGKGSSKRIGQHHAARLSAHMDTRALIPGNTGMNYHH